MATGFMTRHFIALLLLAAALPAAATDISLIGTFDTKAAILSIDGSAPKTVKVGQSFGGVTLIAIEKDGAIVEVDGKRRSLVRGQTFSTSASGDRQSATLVAGQGGHYV